MAALWPQLPHEWRQHYNTAQPRSSRKPAGCHCIAGSRRRGNGRGELEQQTTCCCNLQLKTVVQAHSGCANANFGCSERQRRAFWMWFNVKASRAPAAWQPLTRPATYPPPSAPQPVCQQHPLKCSCEMSHYRYAIRQRVLSTGSCSPMFLLLASLVVAAIAHPEHPYPLWWAANPQRWQGGDHIESFVNNQRAVLLHQMCGSV